MIQEQRRREFVRLEKQLEDDQRQQALLAAQAAANKNHLVQFVAEVCMLFVPSVLWRCWLGGRKGIRPVKKLIGGLLAWLSDWR